MRKLPVVPICRRLAKACGPGTLGLVLSLRKTIPRATVTIRSRTPGRARTTPLTPSRREGRVSRLNLWLLTRVLSTLHTRLRVQPAPGFPCALFSRDKVDARLGRVSAARMMTFVYPLFEILSESHACTPRVAAGCRNIPSADGAKKRPLAICRAAAGIKIDQ
jgi:hypothetical protein